MSDKERLEEIKKARKRILDEDSFQKKCVLLNSFEELGYLDWLIEQAEKTDRYHNVLHKIAYGPETGSEINGIDYRLDHKKWQRLATDVLEGTE